MASQVVIPETSIIGRYMRHMEQQETSTDYDFWCAAWLISNVVGRDTFINRPLAPVYLNLYTILVAESGVTRKSSAVRSATKILHSFVEQSKKAVHIVESKTTPEYLEQQMSKLSETFGYAHTAITASEMVTMFGRERYVQQLPSLMTDLFDCPTNRIGGGTLSRGGNSIKNAYVTFLSASTPSWLFGSINRNIVEGGFTSRCLFIVSEKRKRAIAWPTSDKSPLMDEIVPLMLEMEQAVKLHKSIELDTSAMKAFTKWYVGQREPNDAFNRSFASREDSHILRLAAILAINDGSWIVSERHMAYAIAKIADVRDAGSAIFNNNEDTDKLTKGIVKLIDALVKADEHGIQQTLLLFQVRHYLTTQQMNVLLELMKSLYMVQSFKDQTAGAGRKATIWRATTLIKAPTSVNVLIAEIKKVLS